LAECAISILGVEIVQAGKSGALRKKKAEQRGSQNILHNQPQFPASLTSTLEKENAHFS
jgi:hypothetical protein